MPLFHLDLNRPREDRSRLNRRAAGRIAAPRALSGAEKIEALRDLARRHQHGRVDGTGVDAWTASTIVEIYDALSPENRAKLAARSVSSMAAIAFSLRAKVGTKAA